MGNQISLNWWQLPCHISSHNVSRDGSDVELEDEITVTEGTEDGRHALLSGHNSGLANKSKAALGQCNCCT